MDIIRKNTPHQEYTIIDKEGLNAGTIYLSCTGSWISKLNGLFDPSELDQVNTFIKNIKLELQFNKTEDCIKVTRGTDHICSIDRGMIHFNETDVSDVELKEILEKTWR